MSYDFLKTDNKVDLEKKERNQDSSVVIDADFDIVSTDTQKDILENSAQISKFEFDIEPNNTIESTTVETKLKFRPSTIDNEEYRKRLNELNNNADNKHYVLFFGKPACGKTFIIGSLLHYMKNELGGTVYLDQDKSISSEKKLFNLLQNHFNHTHNSKDIPRTTKGEYFEFNIRFTPNDSSKPPIDIVFVDASGEDSEIAIENEHNPHSGKLPRYVTVILESDVKTKLAFVYDKYLQEEANKEAQTQVLDDIFTKVQLLQRRHNKFYPKILLLAKSDLIELNDYATVQKYNYSATKYAKGIIPSFANSFFNESNQNKSIFYKMGTFDTTGNLLKFDPVSPAKFFAWLYQESTKTTIDNPPSCWERFIKWFKG